MKKALLAVAWLLLGAGVALFIPYGVAFVVGIVRGMPVQSELPGRLLAIGRNVIFVSFSYSVYCCVVYKRVCARKDEAQAYFLVGVLSGMLMILQLLGTLGYSEIMSRLFEQKEQLTTLFFEKQDYDAALAVVDKSLDNWILMAPGSTRKADFLWYKAEIFLRQGKTEQAERLYRTIMKDFPGSDCVERAESGLQQIGWMEEMRRRGIPYPTEGAVRLRR